MDPILNSGARWPRSTDCPSPWRSTRALSPRTGVNVPSSPEFERRVGPRRRLESALQDGRRRSIPQAMRKSGILSTRPDSSWEEAADSGASEALRPRGASQLHLRTLWVPRQGVRPRRGSWSPIESPIFLLVLRPQPHLLHAVDDLVEHLGLARRNMTRKPAETARLDLQGDRGGRGISCSRAGDACSPGPSSGRPAPRGFSGSGP
jgi:hypothetical protein